MRGANAQSAVKKFGAKRRNAPQTAQNLPSDNLHQEKPKARQRAISEKITQKSVYDMSTERTITLRKRMAASKCKDKEGREVQFLGSGYINRWKNGVGIFDSIATLTLRYRLMPKLYLEAVSGVDQALDLLYQFEF